jgi:hypothetical protein
MSSIMWDDPLLARYNFQATDQTTVTAIITAVDAMMDRYTGRNLEQGTYDEVLKVLTTGNVHLPAYPVQQINRVLSDRDNALSVTSTAAVWSISTTATDTVANPGIYLTWFASGTWSNTTLTYAAYPTFTQMAAAISDVATFTCTVDASYAPYPTSDLIAGQTLNGETMGQAGNGNLMLWKQTGSLFEWNPDNGILILGVQPIGDPGGFMANSNGYGLSGYGGRQNFHRGWVRVIWQGGYNPYPEDLCVCAADMVGWMWDGKTNALVSEEYVGDYIYQMSLDLRRVPITCQAILNTYKDYTA